jgi:hypothetical protein
MAAEMANEPVGVYPDLTTPRFGAKREIHVLVVHEEPRIEASDLPENP